MSKLIIGCHVLKNRVSELVGFEAFSRVKIYENKDPETVIVGIQLNKSDDSLGYSVFNFHEAESEVGFFCRANKKITGYLSNYDLSIFII